MKLKNSIVVDASVLKARLKTLESLKNATGYIHEITFLKQLIKSSKKLKPELKEAFEAAKEYERNPLGRRYGSVEKYEDWEDYEKDKFNGGN